MTDIQKARDVLTTWRERATEGPWKVVDGVYSQEGMTYDGSQIEAEYEMVAMDHQDLDCGPVAPLGYSDARLIVLTAGNPDLLDAIDELLSVPDPGNPYMYDPWEDDSVDATNTDDVVHAAVSAGWDKGAYVIAERIAAAIIAADDRMQM